MKIKKPVKLKGSVKIGGSKNAAIPIVCTSLLRKGKVVLKNIPKITDILKLCTIVKSIHCKVKWRGNTLYIDSSQIRYKPLIMNECMEIRGSYYLIPVFLYLFGKCEIALPGGCRIGSRPMDAHIAAFEAFGYQCYLVDNILSVSKVHETKEVKYTMVKKSVGGSINAILCALKSEYVVLDDLVLEPEALCLIDFLNTLGFKIVALRNRCVYKGYTYRERIKPFRIISDRMEAMTFIVLGLLCGRIKVKNVNLHHMKYPLDLLIQAKYKLKFGRNSITSYLSRGNAFDIKTDVYPLFPTDMQSIFGVLLAFSRGSCVVEETIFEHRMQIYQDLISSGACINRIGNKAYIIGGNTLHPNTYKCHDLRQGASVVLLGLRCGGVIENIEIIRRGYEGFFYKLKLLGANFTLN